MKRCCSFAMVLLFIVQIILYPIKGLAIDPEITVRVENVSGEKGKTINLPIVFENINDGINNCDFQILFDSSNIEVKEVIVGEIVNNKNHLYFNVKDDIIYFLFNDETLGQNLIEKDGVFAEVVFKIKEDYKSKETTINLNSKITLANKDLQPINVKFISGKINIDDLNNDIVEQKPPVIIGGSSLITRIVQTNQPNKNETLTNDEELVLTDVINDSSENNKEDQETIIEPVEEIPATSKIFIDSTKHWAKDDILKLFELGIIQGYPDNTVKPDNKITRAEIAVMISKAIGLDESKDIDLIFSDKNEIPSWAIGYVTTLFQNKMISGYEDNTYRAKNNVTRNEIAVMIMNAFEFETGAHNNEVDFKDNNDIPNWAVRFVVSANKLGIINGYEDKTFRPKNNVTRAEVFTMIARCLELKSK